MSIRVAIAEDNPALRKTLLDGLALYQEIEVVAAAPNGAELLTRLAQLPLEAAAQAVLMDIEMPEMDGIAATAAATSQWPDLKVLMLTVFDDEERLFQAICAGASGYLLKDEPAPRIVAALEEAMSGGTPFTPAMARKALGLLRRSAPPAAQAAHAEPDPGVLTDRQLEILNCIVNGMTYSQIADKLYISPKTVRKHTENIYAALHVHCKAEAITLAIQKGWAGPGKAQGSSR